jgi:surface antigen
MGGRRQVDGLVARRWFGGAVVLALALSVPGLPRAAASPAETSALTAGPGMEVLCSQAGYGCVAGTGYAGQSRWGANYGTAGHNCTSYVSFRFAQQGVAQPWRPMGDGGRWDDNGRAHVPVDDQPAVGAVAQWEGRSRIAPGARGHVGYVEAVGDGWVEITDDATGGGTRRFRVQQGSAYWPSHFVHIHDQPSPPAVLGEVVVGAVRDALQRSTGAFGIFLGDWVLVRWRLDSVT